MMGDILVLQKDAFTDVDALLYNVTNEKCQTSRCHTNFHQV